MPSATRNAREILLAKTASRAIEHCLILDAFTAPALTRALLDQVRRIMAFVGLPRPTLELNTVTVGEVECLQVGLSELKQIEAFCSFDPVLWNGARCALHCGLWSARARAQGTAPPAVHVRWRGRYRADVMRSRGVCIRWLGTRHICLRVSHKMSTHKKQNGPLNGQNAERTQPRPAAVRRTCAPCHSGEQSSAPARHDTAHLARYSSIYAVSSHPTAILPP